MGNVSGCGVGRVLCSEGLSGYGVGRVLCSEGLSGYGVGRVLCSEGLFPIPNKGKAHLQKPGKALRFP